MRLAALLTTVLLAAPLADAAERARPAAPAPSPLYEVRDGGFALRLPGDWQRRRDAKRDAREKIFGVTAVGRRNDHGAAVTIMARYYAPGNTSFASAEAYLKRQFKKRILPPPPGYRTYPPIKTELAGRAARSFRRNSSRSLPPKALEPKSVPMREEHVVLPHDDGFFLLSYVAPADLYDEHYAAFERARESFRLLRGEPKPKKK